MNNIAESIWPLWLALARARAEALEIDSDPWESAAAPVQAAWDKLTRPENLNALQAMVRDAHELNSTAREAAIKALSICQARMDVNPAPPTPEFPPSLP